MIVMDPQEEEAQGAKGQVEWAPLVMRWAPNLRWMPCRVSNGEGAKDQTPALKKKSVQWGTS